MKRVLLNTFIFVLVCALLLITGLNIANSSFLFMQDDGGTFSYTDITPASIDGADFLLPEYICAKGEAIKDVAFLANSTTVGEIYSYLNPFILSALTQGRCFPVDDSIWEALLDEKNIVYVRYHSQLMAGVIASHLGSRVPSVEGAGEISELIISVNAQSGSFSLTTRSKLGQVRSFYPPQNGYTLENTSLFFDTEHFSRYAELANNSTFNFIARANLSGISQSSLISPFQPVLDTPPAVSVLNFEATDAEFSPELLAAMGFTPAGLGSYKDELTGDTVYINTLGTIRRGPDRFTFTASLDGGIPLNVTSGREDAYPVFESIDAAEVLLDKLTTLMPTVFGGDARPMLVSVSANGDALTLSFTYAHNNVIILNSDKTAPEISMTVKDGKITDISAELINAVSTSYLIKSYPMFTVLRVLTPAVKPQSYSLLRLAYIIGEGDCHAEWLLETK